MRIALFLLTSLLAGPHAAAFDPVPLGDPDVSQPVSDELRLAATSLDDQVTNQAVPVARFCPPSTTVVQATAAPSCAFQLAVRVLDGALPASDLEVDHFGVSDDEVVHRPDEAGEVTRRLGVDEVADHGTRRPGARLARLGDELVDVGDRLG